MRTITSRRPYHRQGFTLTEMAIVLLIAGVVLAAVWTAVQRGWDNYRFYRATQEFLKVTQNIREFYMGAANLPAAGNITVALDGSGASAVNAPTGLFPQEMRRIPSTAGQPIDNPFDSSLVGGSVLVQGSCPGTTALPCFRVQFLGLTQSVCARLLMFFPVTNTDFGILGIGTQNMTGGSAQTPPLQQVIATTATQWCNDSQINGTNEVDVDFKLHN